MPLNVTFFKFKFILFALIIVVKLIKTFFIVNSSKKINDQKKKNRINTCRKKCIVAKRAEGFEFATSTNWGGYTILDKGVRDKDPSKAIPNKGGPETSLLRSPEIGFPAF